MNKQKGFSAIEAVIIVGVVGLVGFLGWWVYKAQTKPDSAKQQTQQEEQKTEQSQQGQGTDETADWKSYTNTDLGVSFKYPKEWGNVVTEAGAPSGVLLGFSGNYSVVFGSYGSIEGRSGTIYDFDGYTKQGDIYYFTQGSTKDKITPKTVVQTKNSDTLVVDNESFDTLKDYFEVGILRSQDYSGSDLAGLVNVKTTFKGVVFVDQQKRTQSPLDTTLSPGQIPQSDFEKLLSTVEIL